MEAAGDLHQPNDAGPERRQMGLEQPKRRQEADQLLERVPLTRRAGSTYGAPVTAGA